MRQSVGHKFIYFFHFVDVGDPLVADADAGGDGLVLDAHLGELVELGRQLREIDHVLGAGPLRRSNGLDVDLDTLDEVEQLLEEGMHGVNGHDGGGDESPPRTRRCRLGRWGFCSETLRRCEDRRLEGRRVDRWQMAAGMQASGVARGVLARRDDLGRRCLRVVFIGDDGLLLLGG
jgi:hypothetical protein